MVMTWWNVLEQMYAGVICAKVVVMTEERHGRIEVDLMDVYGAHWVGEVF